MICNLKAGGAGEGGGGTTGARPGDGGGVDEKGRDDVVLQLQQLCSVKRYGLRSPVVGSLRHGPDHGPEPTYHRPTAG
jgi:hypothetical protein